MVRLSRKQRYGVSYGMIQCLPPWGSDGAQGMRVTAASSSTGSWAAWGLPVGTGQAYPYPLEIYLGHAPWTCTLDMYLGHAPRHLGCHVPYLVPPWGMHAAPWTDTWSPTWIRGHPWTHVVWRCQRGRVRGLSVGLVSGRAGTSKSVGPTLGSTTAAGWQSPCSPATSGGRRRRHAHALRPVAAPGWQALYHTI